MLFLSLDMALPTRVKTIGLSRTHGVRTGETMVTSRSGGDKMTVELRGYKSRHYPLFMGQSV